MANLVSRINQYTVLGIRKWDQSLQLGKQGIVVVDEGLRQNFRGMKSGTPVVREWRREIKTADRIYVYLFVTCVRRKYRTRESCTIYC